MKVSTETLFHIYLVMLGAIFALGIYVMIQTLFGVEWVLIA